LPVRIVTQTGETMTHDERAVAVEWAVNIVYGGIPFAVMMMTPADLEDFAFGFSLTEGVIEELSDIRRVAISDVAEGSIVEIDLVPTRLGQHLARRRAMTGRTGCGVCGIEDLQSLPRARPRLVRPAPVVSAKAVGRALDALCEGQFLNRLTGAVHAAAFADDDGRLIALREDVGRHNALDKLIGALLRSSVDPGSGFIVITSRCSFEMIEKAGAFGARAVVAISAPTSLALDRARALGITLVGIACRDTMTTFHEV